MTSVLVYSNDPLGPAIAGPGIRSYHFASELAKEFDVTVMAPATNDLGLSGAEIVDAATISPQRLASELQRFDAVVAQFLPISTMRRLSASRRRVIYDLYIPFVERLGFLDADVELSLGAPRPRAPALFSEASRLVQRFALATGTAFICASERQRDLWLGMLAGLGRVDLERYRADPGLRDFVDVVPFGMRSERPAPSPGVLKGRHLGIEPHDRVLVWGGGIWNWLDPLTPIRAVARIARRRTDVKLLFLGLERPHSSGLTAMARRAVALARTLGVLDRSVFFNPGWVPYDERSGYLLEADLGVSAHFASIEAHFAFRARLLDYFWAGLPIVTTAGDVLADLVSEHAVGRVLAPEDVDGWERAIEELLADTRLRQRSEPAFRALRERFSWPSAVAPLARLVRGGPAPGPPSRWEAASMSIEEAVLRLRISLALGGLRGLGRREAMRLARAARLRR